MEAGGEHCCCYWSLLYSAILCSWADSLCLHVIVHEWLAFIACFWISTKVVYLQHWHGWCHMKLLPSWCILCTPHNRAPCHFMQSHTCKVCACLTVTYHLHFWKNNRDLLHASAVTREWDGYWNKSQTAKLLKQVRIPLGLLAGWWLGERQVSGYKYSSSPVTLNCAQEFVLMTFCSYSSLTHRHNITTGHAENLSK